MQALIARRETLARETFERERAALDRMLASEEAPKPELKSLPQPPLPYFRRSQFHTFRQHHRTRMSSRGSIRREYRHRATCGASRNTRWATWARYAHAHPHLPCLLDARRPRRARHKRQGRRCRRRGNAEPVPCHPSHGAALDLPAGVPKDLLGASLATAVGAMRVVSMAEGQQVSIEVTYDRTA